MLLLAGLPECASSYGTDIDGVFSLITWITGLWLLAVQAVLLYAVWRFRARPGQRAAWLPGDTPRQLAWVLGPALAVLACDLVIEQASARVWRDVKEVLPEAPDLTVRITAQQYAWRFTYPGKDGTLGTGDDVEVAGDDGLHVPVDAVVRFELEAVDVVHSLSLPHLRLKQDAVPGRRIPGWFRATKPGAWPLACAELCGPRHTYMMSTLHVEPAADFAAWLGRRGGR